MMNLLLMLIFLVMPVNQKDTITKLQNKFEQITYFSADFSQGISGSNSLSGKFYFSKENNYRIELPDNIIFSDGNTIWNRDIKRKKVIISNVDEDPLAFSFYEYIYDYPSKCEVSEKKSGNEIILTLSSRESDLNFKTAQLWISQDYLITKIRVTDFSGSAFSLLFSNINVNNKIDASKFKFQNDADLKVIDLR